MISVYEVNETNKMIEQENLDVRTITLGISLMDCIDSDLDRLNDNIYKKITTLAGNLVSTGQDIEREFGIPIVNKRISITPIALVGSAACKTPDDYVEIAKTLFACAARSEKRQQKQPKIMILWDVRSWWYFVMHRMTIRLWRVRSLALQKEML